jgi:hypothetical protein
VRTFKVIGIEDLNVRGLSRNRCLARAIMDEGFRAFRSILEYKAKLYAPASSLRTGSILRPKRALTAIQLNKRSRSQPALSSVMIAARRLIVTKTHR